MCKTLLLNGRCGRNPNGQRGSQTRRRLNIYFAANQGDALVYADNSESVRFDFRLKSAAIVFHDYQQLIVAILEHYADATCMCML